MKKIKVDFMEEMYDLITCIFMLSLIQTWPLTIIYAITVKLSSCGYFTKKPHNFTPKF